MGRFTVVIKFLFVLGRLPLLRWLLGCLIMSCSFFPSLAFVFGCFHMSIISFAQPVEIIW